jgi:hypothetical protein
VNREAHREDKFLTLQLSPGRLLVFPKSAASHSRTSCPHYLALKCQQHRRPEEIDSSFLKDRSKIHYHKSLDMPDVNGLSASVSGMALTTKEETKPRAHGFQFECDLCGDESFGVPSIINPNNQYVVCEACAVEYVVPTILEAKANEYSHPPAWGCVTIDYRYFHHWLPRGFAREYRAKRQEYRTPLTERIYCRKQKRKESTGPEEQCGAFLGQKANLPEGVPVKKCPACGGGALGSCMHCGDILPLGNMSAIALHECTVVSSDDEAFEGLLRGEHYQICPGDGCHMRVELAEACNAVVCLGHACRTEFCAICGRRARHDSDHWQAGKPCPRWNQPTSANAGFDTPPEPAPAREPELSPRWLIAQHFWNTEVDRWRGRHWNHLLARDETYVTYLMLDFERAAEAATTEWDVYDLKVFKIGLCGLTQLHFRNKIGAIPSMEMPEIQGPVSEFRDRLEGDADLTLLRLLLLAQHDAFDLLALTRGDTTLLTRDHLTRLMLRCAGCFGVLTVVKQKIEEEIMLGYPRLVNMIHNTVAELMQFVAEALQLLFDHEGEIVYAERMALAPWHVPDSVDEDVRATYLQIHMQLDATRLHLIHKNIPRHSGLAAAIDLFWLQWKNLDTPRLLWQAGSTYERKCLWNNFVVRHRDIEKYAKQVWDPQRSGELEAQLGGIRRTMTTEYDELIERFKSLIPEDFISFEPMADWDGD